MSRDDIETGGVSSAPTVGGNEASGPLSGSHREKASEDSHPVADLVERAAELVEPIKPKLRGWFHAGMVPASLGAGIVLICLAGTPQAVLACTVYSVTAWLLFGTSAVYHLGTWGPLGEAVLRRLDHANIFLIIAGTCTPLAVLLLPPDQRSVLLWIVWAGALAGIAFRVPLTTPSPHPRLEGGGHSHTADLIRPSPCPGVDRATESSEDSGRAHDAGSRAAVSEVESRGTLPGGVSPAHTHRFRRHPLCGAGALFG